MYIIRGLKNSHYVPIVLLPGKSVEVYRTIWNAIIPLCTSRDKTVAFYHITWS